MDVTVIQGELHPFQTWVVSENHFDPGTSIFAVASSEMQRVINAADLIEGVAPCRVSAGPF